MFEALKKIVGNKILLLIMFWHVPIFFFYYFLPSKSNYSLFSLPLSLLPAAQLMYVAGRQSDACVGGSLRDAHVARSPCVCWGVLSGGVVDGDGGLAPGLAFM